ncbi:MAG TPA: hypothetical protein PKE12_09840 [Kiritimatiellia bacterium]|nr:hypothetical protein [Kiritimatiellia bacterium]
MTIAVADAIFQAAATGKIDMHAVPDAQVKELSIIVRSVQRLAKATDTEQTVAPTLMLMRRANFALASTPLPGSWPELRLLNVARDIRDRVSSWRVHDEALPQTAARSVSVLEALAEQVENPLGAKFKQIVARASSEGKQVAVILKDPRYEPMVAQWLQNNCPAPVPVVLVPSALRGCEYYDLLYIFGCPRWFRNDGAGFLFDAPRAMQINVLAFAWGGLEISPEPIFPTAARHMHGFGHQQTNIVVHGRQEPMEPDQADNLAGTAQFDIQAYLARRRAPDASIDQDDEYEARLVQLAGNMAVLLDWDERSKTFCIDMNSGGHEDEDEDTGLVCRRLNRDIEEGMFIVLRTAGGGDMIPAAAESILKAEGKASALSLEAQWKQSLALLRQSDGPDLVCNKLRSLGSIRATRWNLANWIKPRSIRPDADADFLAILSLCRLPEPHDVFLEAARTIDSAHRRAGASIRKTLISQVKKADPRPLKQKGLVVFQLEELSQGASMTAYKVERVQSQTVMTQIHELGRPFQMEDELWQ